MSETVNQQPDTTPDLTDFVAGWDTSGSKSAKFGTDSLIALVAAGSTDFDAVSWTPTLANITLGNGSLTSKYMRVGNTVFYWFILVLGSTSSIGTGPYFTPPVPMLTMGGVNSYTPIGLSRYHDNSAGGSYLGISTSQGGIIQLHHLSGSPLGLTTTTATAPMTWATNDELHNAGKYPAA